MSSISKESLAQRFDLSDFDIPRVPIGCSKSGAQVLTVPNNSVMPDILSVKSIVAAGYQVLFQRAALKKETELKTSQHAKATALYQRKLEEKQSIIISLQTRLSGIEAEYEQSLKNVNAYKELLGSTFNQLDEYRGIAEGEIAYLQKCVTDVEEKRSTTAIQLTCARESLVNEKKNSKGFAAANQTLRDELAALLADHNALAAQRTALLGVLDATKDDLKICTEELETAQKDLEISQKALEHAKYELADTLDTIAKERLHNAELSDIIRELEAQKVILEEKVDSTTAELDNSKIAYISLELERDEILNEINTTSDVLRQEQLAHGLAGINITDLETQVAHLLASLQANQEELTVAKDALMAVEEKLENERVINADLQASLYVEQEKTKDLTAQIFRKDDELTSLIKAHDVEKSELNESLFAEKLENELLKQRETDLQTELEAKSEALSAAQAEIEKLKQALQDRDEIINFKNEELELVAGERDYAVYKLRVAEGSLVRMEDLHTSLLSANERLSDELYEAHAIIEETVAKQAELERSLDAIDAERHEISNLEEKVQSAIVELTKEHNVEMDKLTREKVLLEKSKKVVEEALMKKVVYCEELEKKNVALQERVCEADAMNSISTALTQVDNNDLEIQISGDFSRATDVKSATPIKTKSGKENVRTKSLHNLVMSPRSNIPIRRSSTLVSSPLSSSSSINVATISSPRRFTDRIMISSSVLGIFTKKGPISREDFEDAESFPGTTSPLA